MGEAQLLQGADRGHVVVRAIGDHGRGGAVTERPGDERRAALGREAAAAMGRNDLIDALGGPVKVAAPTIMRSVL